MKRFISPVGIVIGGWILLNLVAIAASGDSLPFSWPHKEGESVSEALLDANVAVLEAILLIGLILWLTRKRNLSLPTLLDAVPRARRAKRELIWLLAYGVLAQIAGVVIARALGWHQFSFHIGGSVVGAHEHELVGRVEFLTWVAYNTIAYVVLPLAILGRRYPAKAIWLRSHNRRADFWLIAIVLMIESMAQLAAVSSAVFDLSAWQYFTGVPLTFVLFFFGTVLPTVIFVEALLVPRFLQISRSIPFTIIFGGFAYTLMHFFDAWMLFDSAQNVVLSIVFLLLTYFGPGMVKTTLTVRTGNAWVHAWAYHAIAPHSLLDTPLVVRIFRL
jgi:hypothetical protein